jgi:hypothetical protein
MILPEVLRLWANPQFCKTSQGEPLQPRSTVTASPFGAQNVSGQAENNNIMTTRVHPHARNVPRGFPDELHRSELAIEPCQRNFESCHSLPAPIIFCVSADSARLQLLKFRKC